MCSFSVLCWPSRLSSSCWLFAILLAWMGSVGSVFGSEESPIVLDRAGIAEIKLPAGEDLHNHFEQRSPSRSDSRVYTADGNIVWVVFVDEDESIEVQTTTTNWSTREEPVRTTWVISVASPSPPPQFSPSIMAAPDRPVGDAGAVFDEARAVGKPEEAKRLGLALRVAREALERQPSIGHTKAQAIVSQWIEEARLSDGWDTFFASTSGYMATHGKTRSSVISSLATIQSGVDAASGVAP